MSKRNDGGPAFPHDGQANYTGGATLRDYFAAKAMQGMLTCEQLRYSGSSAIAEWAYKQADAMLAARETSHD